MYHLSNLCMRDGELHLIDFEMANPKGLEDKMHPRLRKCLVGMNPDNFRKFLLTGLKYQRKF